MHTDYLIIGQGISGTLLSYNLLKEGKNVIIIDEQNTNTASRVASGLINPVTGKRIVKTWMIDELLPVALNTYRKMSEELGRPLISECDILDFHTTRETRDLFTERASQSGEYLHNVVDEAAWQSFFNFHFGIGSIAPCFLIDLQALLKGWRQKLKEQNALLEERFDWQHCVVDKDKIKYKDIISHKVICCEGATGFDNPYFAVLPYSRNKGEVIIASIPGLPRAHIYKNGLKILPWLDDQFWIGSSFEWKYNDMHPTAAYRKQVENWLSYWLKLPCTITGHLAAERPATVEYKPFVGLHPLFPAVGIFNGMGTKGCSLAPFFAKQLTQHLVHGKEILPDVDIKRFSRILSRL